MCKDLRTELAQRLEKTTRMLLEDCVRSPTPFFPPARWLIELEENVTALAKLIGLKQAKGIYLWGAIQRVDHYFPKLGIGQTITSLVKRIPEIPPRPALAVLEQFKKFPNPRASAVLMVFKTDAFPSAMEPWEEVFDTIKPLTSPEFRQLHRSVSSRLQDRFAGWSALVDLKYQELLWWKRYSDFLYFFQWVDGLVVDEFKEKLQGRVIPYYPTRKRLMEIRKANLMRRRAKRSRNQKKAMALKPRISPPRT